jgi:protein TonB
MAYADQKMSGNKITALIIVALIHVAAIYALVTGLAYSAVQKAIEKVTTVDVKEPEKPKPPPPPPPKTKTAPPPPVAPPVRINVATTPPQIVTTVTPPPVAPPIVLAPPPAISPPPPAAPKGPTTAASPRVALQQVVSTDDYPARALRENRGGTVGFRLAIGADGRVSGCDVTSSSGSPDLDQTVCSLLSRRARFKPALQDGQPVASSFQSRFTWAIPKD